MITLISATNRPNSWTRKVAEVYRKRLDVKKVEYKFLDLVDLPMDILNDNMYSKKSEQFVAIEKEYLIPTTKFIFVIPEYNGSYPGILKLMFDASDIKQCYHHKKAALIGVSSGRAGNLRGMDDLTNVLNYLKINVLHSKIPISSVEKQFNDKGELMSKESLRLIDEQIDLLNEM